MRQNSTTGKFTILPILTVAFVAIAIVACICVPTATAQDSIVELESYLKLPTSERPELAKQPFARAPLSKEQTTTARDMLWEDLKRRIEMDRADEMKQRELVYGEHKMRFAYRVLGEPPVDGRSLYISMHGGGGAPARVNDRQWENQKTLYTPDEGVYVAPRAPTDTWNLWHRSHIDPLFARLISSLVVYENVNPNRVYVMGYSAGGDGVYPVSYTHLTLPTICSV